MYYAENLDHTIGRDAIDEQMPRLGYTVLGRDTAARKPEVNYT